MAKRAKSNAKSTQSVARLEPVGIPYRLVSVSVVEFQIHDLSNYKQLPGENLQFMHGINNAIDKEKNYLKVLLRSTIVLTEDANQTPLSTLQTEVVFHVQDLKPLFDKEKKKYVLPPGFLVALIAASIGTARGIFWTKLQGSKIAHVLTPLVNPLDLSEHMQPVELD